MGLARGILVILAALVVGTIGYQIGVTQNLAGLPAASGYCAPHPLGWGFAFFPFFGFLFPLLFFVLVFGLLRAAFWGGRGWGGYGHDGRHRAHLEQIHRELHGDTPSGDTTKTGGRG